MNGQRAQQHSRTERGVGGVEEGRGDEVGQDRPDAWRERARARNSGARRQTRPQAAEPTRTRPSLHALIPLRTV